MGEQLATIQVQSFKRVDLVKASGRIQHSNAQDLVDQFEDLTDNDRYQLVLEGAEITFMSSAGLRAMVGALRVCKKHNGDLRIANPSTVLVKVLELAGLDSIFSVYDDQISAVGSY